MSYGVCCNVSNAMRMWEPGQILAAVVSAVGATAPGTDPDGVVAFGYLVAVTARVGAAAEAQAVSVVAVSVVAVSVAAVFEPAAAVEAVASAQVAVSKSAAIASSCAK